MDNISASKLFLLCHLAFVLLLVDAVHCGAETQVLNLKSLQWRENASPHSGSAQKSARSKGALVLEMKQKAQSSLPIASHHELLHDILITDKSRVSYLQARINKHPKNKADQGSSSEAEVPLISGIKLQSLNYVVVIGVGSKNMTVIVDTGSDLTWIQCKPCFYCYKQQDPIFDPLVSPSYQSVTCNSTTCSSLQQATGGAGVCGTDKSSCIYAVSYGDGSYTRGILAREKINLGVTSIENFVFGCGRSNHGLFGGVAGLMGLGRTQLSLISQTSTQFGGFFSYCLPRSTVDSSGSLVLGDDPTLYKNSTPFSYTRMIADPLKPPFYFLNLTGMRVGGVPIEAAGFSNGQILIDSGTVITRLLPSVYKALKAEFVSQFSSYPTAPSFSILDTCFDLSGNEEVRVPTLRFGFEGGVEMNVDVSGILYFAKKDASQVCLAVASLQYEDDVGIIGNYQQKNQRVIYDTGSSKIGFAQEICS